MRKKPRPLASALWLGFLIACIFQILAPFAIESGKRFLFDDRAYLWDVWKDTTLYWSNPFLVLACAYLLLRLASRRGSGRLSSGWVRGGTALAMIACTQSVTPYRALVSGNSKEPLWFRWVNASIAPDVDHPFRAQQSYSLGMYLARAIPNPWQLGLPNQLRNCSFCSLETYGFLQAEWPTIDFLQQAPLRPGEGFVTGDSVSTVEVYLNRQIRYRSGVNTINPIYVGYLDAATTHEIYWRNRMRIRRNQFGMAYTVADPERNLHWLDAKPGPGGSLEASVSVPSDGDYEIYFGSDWAPQAAQAALNGKPLQHEDSPSLGWEHLAKGQVYSLRVMPAAGQGALSPQTPLVLYPRRYWSYEKFVLEDHGVSGFGSTSIMRWAGVPSSPVTIEDMMALMTTESPVERHETLARDKIRYVVLDPILVAAFPGAASRLDRDPGLTKHQAGDTAIYELK